MHVVFRVPTLPVAQPRPKATTVNGKSRMYEAKKSHHIHDFKATVKIMATDAYTDAPCLDPLVAILTFVFAKKGKCKSSRKFKPTRPDCDNLAKGVLDTLNGLIYKDDGQVVELIVRKYHAGDSEQPHVHVEIYST